MNVYYKKIQSSGGRLTKIKRGIISVLLDNKCLLTRSELVDKLKAKNIKPDRSTVYRELQSLTKNNIIIKSTILDVDYYEIPQDHHHHLVCLNCQQISSVKMDNHLEEQEKILAKQNKFSIVSHSLEFYGYCHECQNIIN